jgi:hypothetical protein
LELHWNLVGTSLEPIGASLEPIGTSWNPLEPRWNFIGTSLEPIGTSLEPIGTSLEPHWNLTGTSLEPHWNLVGTHWNYIWSLVGTHWNFVGTSLEQSNKSQYPNVQIYHNKSQYLSNNLSSTTQTSQNRPVTINVQNSQNPSTQATIFPQATKTLAVPGALQGISFGRHRRAGTRIESWDRDLRVLNRIER